MVSALDSDEKLHLKSALVAELPCNCTIEHFLIARNWEVC